MKNLMNDGHTLKSVMSTIFALFLTCSGPLSGSLRARDGRDGGERAARHRPGKRGKLTEDNLDFYNC